MSFLPIANLKFCRGIRVAIKRYGDLDNILEQIEKDEILNEVNDMIITKQWLIHGRSKNIIKCDDIVWMYQSDGFGVWYSHRRTYIYTKDYKKYCIRSWMTSDALDLYYKVWDTRPWIVVGKSKSMRTQWISRKFECLEQTNSLDVES